MNCIIIDDEPLAREGLQQLLTKIPNVNILDTFSNPLAANQYLQEHTVDLIFIDIEMSDIDGITYIKHLEKKPLFVFVTAYPQYALEGFDVGAFDYLVKPVRIERMLKTINKAEIHFQLLETKIGETESSFIDEDFVFIKSDRRFVKIFFKEIIYIEGLKDYVIIQTHAKKVITAMNIKNIFERLPESKFTRISKSYIINTDFIESVDNHSVTVNKEELPLGLTFRDEFFEKYVLSKTLKK